MKVITEGLLGSSPEFLAIVNTLGHSVLIETIKAAAFYVQHSGGQNHAFKNFQEARSCYAYIQGTGLNMIMERFGLNYNVDYIKSQFNYYVRHSV